MCHKANHSFLKTLIKTGFPGPKQKEIPFNEYNNVHTLQKYKGRIWYTRHNYDEQKGLNICALLAPEKFMVILYVAHKNGRYFIDDKSYSLEEVITSAIESVGWRPADWLGETE